MKRIFGYDDTKDSLISLLNAILNGNPVVKNVTLLNIETLKEYPDNKASRLDIVMPLAANTSCCSRN